MLGDLVSTFTRMRQQSFEGERVACNLCGSRERDVVGTRDRYLRPLRNVLCRGCGLVFLDPMPREDEIEEYYETTYRKHYTGATVPRPVAVVRAFDSARSRLGRLAPVLGAGTRLLDVGAGGGEFVAEARSRGVDATGLEPDPAYVAWARETYDVPVMTGGWRDAGFEPGSFDLITAFHVVEHLRDPLAALREMRRWLVEGGLLHVVVPNVQDPDATPYARFHFAHLHSFCPATLEMAGRKAGFELSPEIAPQGTDVLFRKETVAGEWLVHPGAPVELARFFSKHTNLRYFLSPTPYVRWVRRMASLTRSRWRTLGSADVPPEAP